MHRTQRHISRLAAFLNHLLHKGYNMLDVFSFKQRWPEQPWWMIDFVASRPDRCRHVNDPSAAAHGCLCFHAPRCSTAQVRCTACDSESHFAFHNCPVVGSIVESMREARCDNEQLLLTFAKHSFDDAFRARQPTAAFSADAQQAWQRQVCDALGRLRAAKERRRRRCASHKFDP